MVVCAAISHTPVTQSVRVMCRITANAAQMSVVRVTSMEPEAATLQSVTARMDGKEGSVRRSTVDVGTKEPAYLRCSAVCIT